jgi:glycosyltransferase involved in cell wall biosynthesis
VIILSCSAPFGIGGLGRVLLEAAGGVVASDQPYRIFAGGIGRGSALGSALTVVEPALPRMLAPIPPVRFMPGLQQYLVFDQFDRAVAQRLEEAPSTTVAFSGQALHTFIRARALGCGRLELISPTAHLAHVWRQHRRAEARYPIEGDWLNRQHLDKGLQEYEMADVIYVASDYARESFEREGVPAAKLQRAPLRADSRFETTARRDPGGDRGDSTFRVVYTGALTVVKGVPLLMDAFRVLDDPAAELILIGHTGTRGMRRFVAERSAADRRIRMAPGDPLPQLAQADLYVHPSYQDGFAYAVAEALACGVPVVVTEDTGAKELVTNGVNGEIVPTDDPDALRSVLERRLVAHRSVARPSRDQLVNF